MMEATMIGSKRVRLRGSAVLGLSACLFLANCAELQNKYYGRAISLSGAGVVLDKSFQPYDQTTLNTLIVAAAGRDGGKSRLADTSSLDATLGSFSQALYENGKTSADLQNALRDARNQVQGALLTTSTNRCGAFKQVLRERSTTTNFVLGALTTSLGAAGAIVSGGASQALAGAAAAASGTNAEFNKDIMSNVTSSVIIPGIDKQRSAILQEILNRRCLGVSSYTLTQALADAVRYHAACATDVGVAAASSALSQSNKTTSLADAANTLATFKAMKAMMEPDAATTGGGKSKKKGKAAAGASNDATGEAMTGASARKSPASPASKNAPLVGDSVNYLQCTSLTASGTLDENTGSTEAKGGDTGGQVQYGRR
jgi:hypothetical protein